MTSVVYINVVHGLNSSFMLGSFSHPLTSDLPKGPAMEQEF
jgi:hypothetical protein